MNTYIGKTLVRIIQGDITHQDTMAVVNAANSGLWGGSGVDGAIHNAGGPTIMEECRKIRESQGGCPTGQAVLTSGGNLKACHVIHTVGPVWQGGNNDEDELLGNAYLNSLIIAKKHNLHSVSFPSISTGVYRFPVDRAAAIALSTVRDFIITTDCFNEIRFVLFSQNVLHEFSLAWKRIMANSH